MTGIIQLFLKSIGLFLKTLFWIISASIRLVLFLVTYLVFYILLGILLPMPFLLLFSFKGFIKKWKDFGPNSMKIFFGFFPEIKRLFTKSKNKKIDQKKQQILKEYIFPANDDELTDMSSRDSSTEREKCKSCGAAYSDRMIEILKKGENLLYCEFCGTEI